MLSLWFTAGSLLQASLEGLGSDPYRRGAIGIAIVLLYATMLWRRAEIQLVLRQHPWSVVLLSLLLVTLALIDEPVGSPYFSICLTAIGLAVIVARALTVWASVAAVAIGLLIGATSRYGAGGLLEDGRLGTLLGALVGTVLAALLLLGIRRQLFRFTDDLQTSLDEIRRGLAPVYPRPLQAAVTDGPRQQMLPAARRHANLSPAEQAVIEALAVGRAPKQIAVDRGVSLATVRTQIRHAKRKTGARTLRELASMTTRPDWPDVEPL